MKKFRAFTPPVSAVSQFLRDVQGAREIDYCARGAPIHANLHAMCALRFSWMLESAARRAWHAMQVEQLRDDIVSLGVANGGTGRCEADRMILDWCPAVLPDGFAA